MKLLFQVVSELENLSSNVTSLIMGSNICNSNSITLFNLTNFEYLELIDIGSDNLMYVNRFVINGLNHLKSLKIGIESFEIIKDWNEFIYKNWR